MGDAAVGVPVPEHAMRLFRWGCRWRTSILNGLGSRAACRPSTLCRILRRHRRSARGSVHPPLSHIYRRPTTTIRNASIAHTVAAQRGCFGSIDSPPPGLRIRSRGGVDLDIATDEKLLFQGDPVSPFRARRRVHALRYTSSGDYQDTLGIIILLLFIYYIIIYYYY